MKKRTISTICALVCLTGLVAAFVRNFNGNDTQQNNMAETETGMSNEAEAEEADRRYDSSDLTDDVNTDKLQEAEKENTATETDAEKQYREFMNGTGSLMTAERFREDDSEYNDDGLLYGEYTCGELKENIEKLEYTTSEIKYALVDLNSDGEKELALQFASTEDGGENWVGIIRCKEGKLELTYSYEYGYRTEATLYENGLLAIGGSWGAGAHGMDYYRFDENCEADRLFSNNAYIGSFATQIAYDLQTDQSEVLDPTGDSDLLVESRLEVSEYIPAEKNGKGVKLSASGYSEDAGVKAAEEKMLQDLVAQGAELISGDEMDQLCSIETGTEVTWEIP